MLHAIDTLPNGGLVRCPITNIVELSKVGHIEYLKRVRIRVNVMRKSSDLTKSISFRRLSFVNKPEYNIKKDRNKVGSPQCGD